MSQVDIVYLAWNRLAFTRLSFRLLIENTDWSLVRRLQVYDDGSTDGTREFLDDALADVPVPGGLCLLGRGSPVSTMLHYLGNDPSERFVKLDNDIAVPPGWLNALVDVSDRNPEIELLGMEAGMTRLPEGHEGPYGWRPCSWIGGVGLMRSASFLRHPPMRPNGRFGFTRWQQDYEPVRGWIEPDLLAPQLDRIPVEPWASLSARYVADGWQRSWPSMDDRWGVPYWDWIS